MGKRPGPIQVLFKYWKRSIIAVPAFVGATWFFYDYTVTSSAMKVCCARAAEIGDEKLSRFDSQPRHITVILNPVAGNRRSKKLYQKWVEPLLHLGGIRVSLIETESPKQATELMKVMSNCDGVAIVGGDGTIHEALNGLMSRPDCANASKQFPIAIIPTGQYNSIARLIHQGLIYRNQKDFLMAATMSLVNSVSDRFDVLKISSLDNEEEKPIYALRDVRYGKYQDNYYKTSGYHIYQTYIKPIWLRFRRTLTLKRYQPEIESISFTDPCEGCSRCWERHQLKNRTHINENGESANRRWWRVFAPVANEKSDIEKRELELAKRDNPDCNQWKRVNDLESITDFRACLMNLGKVRLSLGRGGEYNPSESIATQDVRLQINVEVLKKNEEALELAKNDPEKKDDGKSEKLDGLEKFLIDRDPVEVKSIAITTIRQAVRIFTGRLTALD